MLEVFKTLPTVDMVVRAEALASVAASRDPGYGRDTITLGWEERLKGRGRRRSDGGVEFGTALPRGTVLRDGDALFIEVLRLLVIVREQREAVLVVTPSTRLEWGLFGYHIGNSHQPVMFTDHAIVCLNNLGMRQVLEQHAIPFQEDDRPFTPVGQSPDHRH